MTNAVSHALSPWGHWYLHNLARWGEGQSGSESLELAEIYMVEQRQHRHQDPEPGQQRRRRVTLLALRLSSAEADQDVLEFHGLRRIVVLQLPDEHACIAATSKRRAM